MSGGPDSLALLLLAAAALPPGEVEAATVDHGLRAESAAEAQAVAAICARLGVRHETLGVSLAPGNVQAEARKRRYQALGAWMARRGLAALCTAHHADDQAETLLMRLNRGSGVAGLAGVRASARVPESGLPLLRPLLGWRRAELARVVSEAGLAAACDPSNADDRFDRARLRRAMAGAGWLRVESLAASAGHLAEADEALEWAADREWQAAVTTLPQGGFAYRPTAPRAIALRVLARILAELGASSPRGGAVARMHDALAQGRSATLAGVRARPRDGVWRLTREGPRRTGQA